MNKPRFTGEDLFAVSLEGNVLSNFFSADAAHGFQEGLTFLEHEKYSACTVQHLVGLYDGDVICRLPAPAYEAAVKLAQDEACHDLAQALLCLYPEWDDLSWPNQERLFKGFIQPEPEVAPKPLYEPRMPERYVPAPIPWLDTPIRTFRIDRPYVVEGTPLSAALLAEVDVHAMRPQGAGRVEAIKLVRASTGLGMREALGLVDTIWHRRHDQEPGAYHDALLDQQ